VKLEGTVVADGSVAYVLTEKEEEKLDQIVRAIADASVKNYKNYSYRRDSAAHERSQERVNNLVEKFEGYLFEKILGVTDAGIQDEISSGIGIGFISDVQCPFGTAHYFEKAAKKLLELNKEPERSLAV